MGSDLLTEPLQFTPIFKERIWGGRRLKEIYDKQLPPAAKIGESWEISDRTEAQSVVLHGPFSGRTLHELWMNHRRDIFGVLPESERFPLLIKLLDAHEKLSVQVHPPAHLAAGMGGEPKTEFWYIADATDDAELFVGLRNSSSRERFIQAIQSGDVSSQVHRIPVRTGDALLLPSGRLHAIGAGNLIVEIQQNSDTTYRVFDWDRLASDGKPRQLHIEEALRCIDFEDREPKLLNVAGELLVRHSLFEIQRWDLTGRREIAPSGRFAILFCLAGDIMSGGIAIKSGRICLNPCCNGRSLHPAAGRCSQDPARNRSRLIAKFRCAARKYDVRAGGYSVVRHRRFSKCDLPRQAVKKRSNRPVCRTKQNLDKRRRSVHPHHSKLHPLRARYGANRYESMSRIARAKISGEHWQRRADRLAGNRQREMRRVGCLRSNTIHAAPAREPFGVENHAKKILRWRRARERKQGTRSSLARS